MCGNAIIIFLIDGFATFVGLFLSIIAHFFVRWCLAVEYECVDQVFVLFQRIDNSLNRVNNNFGYYSDTYIYIKKELSESNTYIN